ncbi:hypothetical protein LTS18_006252, partial [Coniosporium uncinatum]
GTLAEYDNLYDLTSGAIWAVNNLSPGKANARSGRAAPLPDLQLWSDVVFLEWARRASNDDDDDDGVGANSIKNLKFVLRLWIVNVETCDVIAHALRRLHPAREESRLVHFENEADIPVESEEGKALLGTPNGRGVAWLLVQHRRQLGRKTVAGVRVWVDGTCVEEMDMELCRPNMVFYVRDVVEDGGEGDVGS